ncbi:zinc finger protein 260-like isoform X1 [Ambystoma mexicanum]|uniref:zinc finger protein 260-like isoform X1 n=1 Tax=Ambystoma mexicanum TaxID=8296 RepID=UPI0037E8748B
MSQQRRGRRMVGKLRTMNGKSAPQVGEDEQGASKEESTASEDIVYIDHMGISYQGPPNSSKYACSNKLAKDTFQSQVKNRVTTSQPSTDGKASSNDSAKHVETSTMTSKANTSCNEESKQCFKCHIIFINEASQLRHMKRHHPEDFAEHVQRDPLCYQTAQQEERRSCPRPDQEQVVCPDCGKKFPSTKAMHIHKTMHGKPGLYPCAMCGRLFKLLSTLTKHQRSHSYDDRDKAAGPYRCEKCGAMYPASRGLRMHEWIHKS